MGKAVQQYADDFNGYKPKGGNAKGTNGYWYAQVGGFQDELPKSRYLANPFGFEDDRSRSFWVCKMYRNDNGSLPRSTYGVNYYLGRDTHLKFEHAIRTDNKIEKVPSFSQASYIYCGTPYGIDCAAQLNGSDATNTFKIVHNGKTSMPILYLDGHCGTVRWAFLQSCLNTQANKPLNRIFWGVH